MKLGLCSTLFIVLLVLKLTELIAITWIWVCMPLIVMLVWWFLILIIFMGAVVWKVMDTVKNG